MIFSYYLFVPGQGASSTPSSAAVCAGELERSAAQQMQQRDIKLIIVTATSVLFAAVASELLYWYLLVPRLPHFSRVPLPWWIAVFSPYGVTSLLIGFFTRSASMLPLHAVVAACVSILGRLGILRLMGRPPAHDMRWEDMLQHTELIFFPEGILFLAVIFGFVLFCGILCKTNIPLAERGLTTRSSETSSAPCSVLPLH